MHRLYAVLRAHPTRVDTFWAVLLVGASLMSGVALYEPGNDWAPVWAPIVIAQCGVMALRRRYPERMLLLAMGSGVAQLVLDVPVNLNNVALLVITYTVASVGRRWASRLALVGGLLAGLLAALRWSSSDIAYDGWTVERILQTVVMTIPFVLAWVLGDSSRTRRAYYAQLEERAARLEREREAQSKVAVAAERARIARELHDVVAHNVSVMIVQADGAAYVLDTSPEQSRQALETISYTGRQALAEMRRLLGVLRPSVADGGEYVPQPGVEQLSELVEQVRGAGLPIRFHVEGTPRALPTGVELTAYRIVQEALTNTRKHGGSQARASVRLTYGEHDLDMLIEDDGRGSAGDLYVRGGVDGSGHGLIGMRERVGMVGGRLEAGPRLGGGFRINAVLPLKTSPS